MHEDNLKKQLLLGFIAMSFKFTSIEELRRYLLNFVNANNDGVINEEQFYNTSEFMHPEYDEYWIENQIREKKIYKEDLVRYKKNNVEKIGVVKEIIDKNCILVFCTANCTDKSDYDTVFISDIIESL